VPESKRSGNAYSNDRSELDFDNQESMVESQIDQFKFGGTKELGLDKYKEDEKQIIREQSRENLEKNDTSNEV